MGEGGAVFTNRSLLKRALESIRDWGRDCYCEPGKDNTCNKRFCQQLGELPFGYDHKYTYSHLGFNLKPLDPQAAIGRVQLKRLPEFIETRKRNWQILREGLAELENVLEGIDAPMCGAGHWFHGDRQHRCCVYWCSVNASNRLPIYKPNHPPFCHCTDCSRHCHP